ncbi:MAG: tetratricopeptide repeat protein, partial [Candidatus Schekmanbacteria bacterium]
MRSFYQNAEKDISLFSSLIILFLLIAIIYGFTFSFPFHYDDWKEIVNNESIRYSGTIKDVLLSEASRPLTILSFAANYHLSGLSPSYYRGVNILLHFLNSFFLFLILKFLSKKERASIPDFYILISASIFLIHPLQTESVTYISSRSELFVFFFCSASSLLFLKSLHSEKRLILGISALILFILALLSKERAVIYPFIVFSLLLIFKKDEKKRIFKNFYIVGCFTADVLYVIYRFYFAAKYEVRYLPRTYFQQALGALEAFRIYSRLLIFPINQNIDHTVIIPSGIRIGFDAIIVIAFFSFACLLWKKRNDYKFLLCGIILFLFPLIPNLLIPIEDLVAERWMYMSVAGLSFIFFYLFSKMLDSSSRRKKALLIMPCILLILLACERNSIWSDEVSLWKDAAVKSPFKAKPLNNMAYVHIQRKEYKKAEEELLEALKLDSHYGQAYFNLGTLFSETERYDKAIEFFKRAYEINKDFKGAPVNIGVIYARAMGNYAEAEKWFRYALNLDKDFVPALVNIAELFYVTKRYKDASAVYAKLIELGAGNRRIFLKFADSLRKAGFLDKALKSYMQYNKLYGKDANLLLGMGKTYFLKGNLEEALAYFNDALELDKNSAEAYGNIALIYLKKGKSEKALHYLDKLIEIK